MSTHYIAKVVIERITTPDPPEGHQPGRIVPALDPQKRSVATVASIIVPGADLESLKRKVTGHMALVEDEGDIDNRSKGGTTRG